MSTMTLGFFQRQEHGLGRSFALSALVHIALAVVLFLGVRWQSHAPDTVTVDLVAAPPPPAPMVQAPKPSPPPKPVPEVVKPEPKPAPPVAKPDIALREKPKPKPKPEPKKVEKKVEARPDPNFKKQLQAQVAAEQKVLDQQKQERALRDLLAAQQADAARTAAAARAKGLNEYIGRIQASIRQRIRESALEGIPGNPAAEFDVVQLPTGDVISVRMRKSSGYPRYDEEVNRAIRAASPLPQPSSREDFSRELKLTFRPRDK